MLKFEIVTRGYDPSAVTLVKLKNGAVIARSTTPIRDTMKPYADTPCDSSSTVPPAPQDVLPEHSPKQWPEDRIK